MVAIKPVILFVHGAWQTASQWQPLAQGLTSIGYNVSQPQSPSSGTDIAALRGKTYRDDVSVIHSAMEPYLEAGREIVIVSHSYGGIPASAAVEGNQVHERRARGLSGGIKHIVYLAAFALPAKNTSLLTTIGGKFGPYMNNMVSSPGTCARQCWIKFADTTFLPREMLLLSGKVPKMLSTTIPTPNSLMSCLPRASFRAQPVSRRLRLFPQETSLSPKRMS